MIDSQRRNRGFTLIEVMITVVIIGILASIAYPSYIEHVKRGRQAEAQGQIMELASALEAHRAKNFSYSGATLPGLAPTLDASTHYDAVLALANSNQTFTITATPSTATMSGMSVLTLSSSGDASWD